MTKNSKHHECNMHNVIKANARKAAHKFANWDAREEKAMKRFVAAWLNYQEGGNPEELNTALDTLTVAHAAATFEWASGPLKW